MCVFNAYMSNVRNKGITLSQLSQCPSYCLGGGGGASGFPKCTLENSPHPVKGATARRGMLVI